MSQKDERMTEEQRQFAEENHNLIYHFLHKYHLDIDEWYDVAAIGFCEAVINYNSQTRFSTYAYVCMRNRVGHTYITSKRQKRGGDIKERYLDELLYEYDEDMYNVIACDGFEDFEAKLTLEDILKRCKDEKKRNIIKNLAAGITRKEIANMFGCTRNNIDLHVKEVQKQYKKELRNDKGDN